MVSTESLVFNDDGFAKIYESAGVKTRKRFMNVFLFSTLTSGFCCVLGLPWYVIMPAFGLNCSNFYTKINRDSCKLMHLHQNGKSVKIETFLGKQTEIEIENLQETSFEALWHRKLTFREE